MDFESLDIEARSYGLEAPHVHGALSGFICGQGDWEEADDAQLEDLVGGVPGAVVRGWLDETLAQLSSLMMVFSPLIPDTNADFSDRTLALAQWCEAFIEGYALAALDGALPREVQEILSDLVQVAEMDPDTAESNAAEFQLNEVFEYVKVAVLTLFGALPMATGFGIEDED